MGFKIPPVEGKNLNNSAIELPKDLAGKPSVIAFGFSRAAGRVIRSWIKEFDDNPKVFQIPVLEGVPFLFRSITEMVITRDTEAKRRDEVILLYKDEKKWRERLAVNNDETAYLLVVDGEGNVIERLHGEPSKYTVARVRNLIAELNRN